jgi:hypothetical protein
MIVKSNKSNYVKLGLLPCIVLLGINSTAQQTKLSRKQLLHEFIFKSNHIRFEGSALSVLKAKLKNQSGTHPVKSSVAPGLAFSIKYQFNFNNEYGLIIGPEATVAGRNFITSFNKNDFSPPLNENTEINAANSFLADLILSFSATFEKRILYKPTKYLFLNSGLRFNVSTGADFDIFTIVLPNGNNGFYDAGGVDVYANNDAKPWLSVPLNAGHSWLLKNNNLLQLSLCSNISFTKYVNGTYRIDIPGRTPTTGLYSSSGSYIGLSLNYVFTNTNFKIRRAYEKK